MSKPPLWTRDFIIISVLNFFLVIVFYLLIVVLGQYATETLGASISQAGMAVGMFVVGVLIGRLVVGQYIDRLGRKRTMVVGLGLSVLTTLLYFLPLGIGFLIFNRLVHGLAVGIAATATSATVAFLIPASRKGEGIGFYTMSATLATATGPFIGVYVVQHVSFEATFLLCSLVTLMSLLVALPLRVPELDADEKANTKKGFSWSRLVEPTVLPLCGLMFFLGMFYSGVLSFLNVYAIERSIVEAAGFFFIAYSSLVLMSRPITGRLLDIRSANVVMYPAFIIMALGYFALGSAHNGYILLLAGALIGLGYGNIQSSLQAIAIKHVEPRQFALATSTFYICMDAGLGFGPYLLGLVVPLIGYGSLYLAMSGACLAVLAAYVVIYRRLQAKAASPL